MGSSISRRPRAGIELLEGLIEQNTELTAQVNRLTQEIHRKVAPPGG